MRVTRLEVFGFKSFMERLVLPLEGGITGVVGPNGCGKSNVVDALRWVLGETRARSLRGEHLEDVIFNGTDKLRPLGLAEVTITLRAAGANFFDELLTPEAEIEIEDAVVVSAEKPIDVSQEGVSEDKSPDTNSAAKSETHLKVIDGGLLAEKTEEVLDDESLGEKPAEPIVTQPVSKTASQGLLHKFSWLGSVNEVQVTRRLYRSGESEFFINRVACRLSDLKELFRSVGLGARTYTIVAQGEVSRIISAKPDDVRVIFEEAAGISGFKDRITAANKRLEETVTGIARIDDVLREVTRQVATLKRQAQRAVNRKELKAELERLDLLLAEHNFFDVSERSKEQGAKIAGAEAQVQGCEAALQAARAGEETARGGLVGFDVEIDGLRSKMDSIREELRNRQRARDSKSARIREIQASLSHRKDELSRIEERRAVLEGRAGECAKQIERLNNEEKELGQKIQGLTFGGDEDLKKSARTLDELRTQLRAKENEVREVREKLISAQSSLKAAQDQLIAASPINQLKRTLGTEASDMLARVAPDATLFVNGLVVPPEFAKAVQALLAERAHFLVATEPEKIARHFVATAQSRDPENRKGLGLGVLRRRQIDIPQQQDKAGMVAALGAIKVAGGFEHAACAIFDGVYFVPQLEEALAYFEANQDDSNTTLVTKDGEIVTNYSFFTLRHEGGLVQLRNRIEELSTKVDEYKALEEQRASDRSALQASLHQEEQRHSTLLRESQQRQAEARALSNSHGAVRGRLSAEQRAAEQIKSDLNRLLSQTKEGESRLSEWTSELAKVNEELSAMTGDQEKELEASLGVLQSEANKIDAVRKERRATLSAAAEVCSQASRALDNAKGALASLKLAVERIAIEKENLNEKILRELGSEVFANLQARMGSGNVQRMEHPQYVESNQAAQKIRDRIIREGEVDPTSVERYEEEQRRLEDLTGQRADLERAASTLKQSVQKLVVTSEKRFLEVFEAINRNFGNLVPRLYGGGNGSLELLNPASPLTSGVDIVVRPPGKKLKSIELMSGGEKALAAIGLIFSMFLERPSPLCVLDEVDAPLDEANLIRYLALVKEMSKRTQFIMITHNKRSMMESDTLVGVTMQEPGASKIISVSLQEAFKQVA